MQHQTIILYDIIQETKGQISRIEFLMDEATTQQEYVDWLRAKEALENELALLQTAYFKSTLKGT